MAGVCQSASLAPSVDGFLVGHRSLLDELLDAPEIEIVVEPVFQHHSRYARRDSSTRGIDRNGAGVPQFRSQAGAAIPRGGPRNYRWNRVAFTARGGFSDLNDHCVEHHGGGSL